MSEPTVRDGSLVERGGRLARARRWARRRFVFTHQHQPLDVDGLERRLGQLPARSHAQLHEVFARLEAWEGARTTLSLEAMLSRFIPAATPEACVHMMEDGRYWRRAALLEQARQAALRMDLPEQPPAEEGPPLPEEVVECFRRATRITFLVGAGISRAAGIPTYRGDGSLPRPREEEGKKAPLPPLATFPYYLSNPDVVWAHFAELRRLLSTRRPTPAHRVVAALAQRYAGSRVITQNIDGLERAAGVEPLALHGQATALTCLKEGRHVPARDERYNDDTFPICPHDGALLKPGVVFFLEGIEGRRFDAVIDQIRDSDLYVEVGTSHTVYPAKDFWKFARSRGLPVVLFNSEPLKDSDSRQGARLVLGDCQRTLPALYRQLLPDSPLEGTAA